MVTNRFSWSPVIVLCSIGSASDMIDDRPLSRGEEARSYFRELVAGLHNILIEEEPVQPDDLNVYFLNSRWVEAEVLLPDFGINLDQWNEWSVPRRIEVLLHELAHVQNYDDDHRPDFWSRVANLVLIVEQKQEEIETLLGHPLDMDALKKQVVKSVHEDEVDERMDTVEEQKKRLRKQFGFIREKSYPRPDGAER